MSRIRIFAGCAALAAGLVSMSSIGGSLARAETAKGWVIQCTTDCRTCLCVSIPGEGGISQDFYYGPASFTWVSYAMPAPDFVPGYAPATAIFAFTDSQDPDIGMGWVDVKGFYAPDGTAATVYDENQMMYTSYAAWTAVAY